MVLTTTQSARSIGSPFRRRLGMLLVFAWFTVGWPGLQAQPADHIVDLTQPAPVRKVIKRGPGVVMEFPRGKLEVLPLELSLLHIAPRTWIQRERVIIELLVRNTGSQPVNVPISRDFDEQFAAGRTARIMMDLDMTLTPEPGSGARTTIKSIEVTVGSLNDPTSFIKLLPGQTVKFITSTQVETSDWAISGFRALEFSLRPSLQIGRILDDEYIIKPTSDAVVSTNAVDMKWRLQFIDAPANQ